MKGEKIVIGLASGLGNCVDMLPAVKATKLLGYYVTLYVETDFPTAELWRRCIYADQVLEAPAAINGSALYCGNWRPETWRNNRRIQQTRLPAIHSCEWLSNFRLAARLGWKKPAPDISDWCRGLDRRPRWDVGLVPGSKPGVWIRKRWPHIAAVAGRFISSGLRVAIFGQETDGLEDIPGERIRASSLAELPDFLAGCRVLVGTDSGPTLLASSLGVPVVVIYTATSANYGAPVGPNKQITPALPCHPCVSTSRWFKCGDWKCRDISPDLVVNAAEEFLRG